MRTSRLTSHRPPATPPKPDFPNSITACTRAAHGPIHGHAHGFLTGELRTDYGRQTDCTRTCNGLTTDTLRTSYGLTTGMERACHGRSTVLVLSRDACRAGGCVFVSCSFCVRSSFGRVLCGVRLVLVRVAFVRGGRSRGGSRTHNGLLTDGTRTHNGLLTDCTRACLRTSDGRAAVAPRTPAKKDAREDETRAPS